jgi:predicted  nucleic acid-binding Zn-ribbon protein
MTPSDIFEVLRDLSRLDENHRRSPETSDLERRHTLHQRLPREIAQQYDRLLSAGRRPAVVGAPLGHCQACHMRVPPQLLLLLSRAELICRCPSCHRFLCPPPATPERTPHA